MYPRLPMALNHEFLADDAYNNHIVDSLSQQYYKLSIVSSSPITTNTQLTIVCPSGGHVWYGAAGHLHESQLLYGCPLCRYANICINTPSPVFEQTPRPFSQREAIMICRAYGHRFLVNVDVIPKFVACPVCYVEKRARYGPVQYDVKFLDTVYVHRFTHLRYKCNQCGIVSMTSCDLVCSRKNSMGGACTFHHTPQFQEEIVRCRRLFELCFMSGFDDYDTLLFQGLYPNGYSRKHKLVYFHLAHSSIHPSQESMLSAAGLRVVIIPANIVKLRDILAFVLAKFVEFGEIPSDDITHVSQKLFKRLRPRCNPNCYPLMG